MSIVSGRYLSVMEKRATHCKKEAARLAARARRTESKIGRTKQMVLYYLESDENFLALGPYRGVAIEHIRIPVTEGICGAAVAQGETVVVEDVSADPRYCGGLPPLLLREA